MWSLGMKGTLLLILKWAQWVTKFCVCGQMMTAWKLHKCNWTVTSMDQSFWTPNFTVLPPPQKKTFYVKSRKGVTLTACIFFSSKKGRGHGKFDVLFKKKIDNKFFIIFMKSKLLLGLKVRRDWGHRSVAAPKLSVWKEVGDTQCQK